MDVLEQVAGEGLLPAIKICADWLQGDKSVVEAVGRDSLEVLKSFVDLVNVINIDIVELEKGMAFRLFFYASITMLSSLYQFIGKLLNQHAREKHFLFPQYI